MKRILILLLVSLMINILFVFKIYKDKMAELDNRNYWGTVEYNGRVEMLNVLNKKTDIVMLGDSLTDFLDWHSATGLNISNQGIGNDRILKVLNRLNHTFRVKPQKCYIMIGINDLADISVDAKYVFSHYKTLLFNLKSKNITPIVQSTLFVAQNRVSYAKINKNVAELNLNLQKYCAENNIKFIDLNSKLSENGYLNPNYTYDGLHLNSKGYKIWIKTVFNL